MKRILLIVIGAIALVVLAVAGLIASAFIGKSPIDPGVVDGFIHVVKDGYVTVNILDIGDGKVALIDAGDDKTGKAVRAELTAMKRAPADVTAIFLTHGHPDHLAAAPLFPNAKVYALAADVPLAEGREGGHGLLTRFMPVRPTGVHIGRALTDGEVVYVGNRAVHVFAIPGHTAGSAAYWVDGNLFMGDSAAANGDGTMAPSPAVFSDDPEQNRESLKQLAKRLQDGQFVVRTMHFAHSGRLTGIQPLLTFANSK